MLWCLVSIRCLQCKYSKVTETFKCFQKVSWFFWAQKYYLLFLFLFILLLGIKYKLSEILILYLFSRCSYVLLNQHILYNLTLFKTFIKLEHLLYTGWRHVVGTGWGVCVGVCMCVSAREGQERGKRICERQDNLYYLTVASA